MLEQEITVLCLDDLHTKTNVMTFADPPEIEVDQGWVNVAEGNQGKLICTVYGNPTPNVSHCFSSYYLFILTKTFAKFCEKLVVLKDVL